MSLVSFLRSPRGIAAVVALLLVLAGATWWFLSGDDEAKPLAADESPSSTAPSAPSPTASKPSASATPEATSTPAANTPTCEGPDTRVNVEGVQQDSLLPDCAEKGSRTTNPSTPLGLACGGKYPIILYKTNTGGSKSSICGVDSSGEKLRVVVQPAGGKTLDLKGSYDYRSDSFVAKDGATSYAVQAYDGTILTTRNGQTKTETSDDWSSLDNESDYD